MLMDKIYLNLKLKCLLPSEIYKVADMLFACQKEGCVTYSSNNIKSLHIPKEAVEIAIQTLIDRQILEQPVKEGSFWKFKINTEVIKRYNDASWDDINNAPVLKKSSELKFTHQPEKEEMSVEEMKKQIAHLQSLLNTRDEFGSLYAPPEHAANDIAQLPW